MTFSIQQFSGIVILISIMTLMSCGFDDTDPGLSFEKQLAFDIDIIETYLVENEIEAEVHESGIRYVHNILGVGDSPEIGDLVVIKFNAKLLNGVLYGEDSIGFTLKLSDPTIKVLQLIIPLMNVGGTTTIYSPSGYSFGKSSGIGLPANSNFIFEIELLALINNVEEQLIADENIIDEFLLESELPAEIHESGIRYITLVEGTGSSPLSTDLVTVKYKGTILNGQVFDQNATGVQFSLSGVIEAWTIMVPTMKVGGKIKIYAPSQYCYGPGGYSTIPPNTILVFEIELVSIN